MDDTPTELTREDLIKAMGLILKGPRKCSCGNGFPAEYQVSDNHGHVWDLMCVNCFQDVTKDGKVIQICT